MFAYRNALKFAIYLLPDCVCACVRVFVVVGVSACVSE